MIDKRLISTFPQSKKYISFNVFLKIISLIMSIAVAYYFADFLTSAYYDKVFKSNSLILILIASILRSLIAYYSSIFSYKSAVGAKMHFRNKVFSKIFAVGLRNKYKLKEAELIQMSVEGIEQLSTYYGMFLPQIVYSLLSLVVLFIFLSRIDFNLALINLSFVPLIPIAIIIVQKTAKRAVKNYWGRFVNLTDIFMDNLKGLTTLKIYDTDKKRHQMINEYSEKFRISTMKVLTVQLNNITVMDIIAYCGTGIVTAFAIKDFTSGTIDLKGAIIFILLSVEFFLPLRMLGSFFHVAMTGMTSSNRMFEIFEMQEIDKDGKKIDSNEVDIELKNLSFGYENNNILENVDMKFNKNSLTAIVGESGSGKSTIASLIFGNNVNYTGDLLINGISHKDYGVNSIYEKITLINNKPYIFEGTVRYNLQMAKPDASDEMMIDSLKKVNLYDVFYEREGLDTMIESQGKNLSGGQIQRLSIARALLKDSALYIFDEATSNIDIESEKIILDLIDILKNTKNIIFISHRLKSIENADLIYVLDNKKIVESGNFEDLMKNQNRFYNMYKAQSELEEVRRIN